MKERTYRIYVHITACLMNEQNQTFGNIHFEYDLLLNKIMKCNSLSFMKFITPF